MNLGRAQPPSSAKTSQKVPELSAQNRKLFSRITLDSTLYTAYARKASGLCEYCHQPLAGELDFDARFTLGFRLDRSPSHRNLIYQAACKHPIFVLAHRRCIFIKERCERSGLEVFRAALRGGWLIHFPDGTPEQKYRPHHLRYRHFPSEYHTYWDHRAIVLNARQIAGLGAFFTNTALRISHPCPHFTVEKEVVWIGEALTLLIPCPACRAERPTGITLFHLEQIPAKARRAASYARCDPKNPDLQPGGGGISKNRQN